MKVLVADDHVLFLQSIQCLMEKLLPGVDFVFSQSLQDAKRALEHDSDISVAILDYHMPGSIGIETIRSFIQTYPKVNFAIITGRMTRTEIASCVRLGLSGIIFKEFSANDVVDAVSVLMRGGIYLPESVILNDNTKPATRIGAELTTREEEVLRKIHEGLSNKEVARQLDISDVTVKMHVTSLLKKYKAKNRTELAVKCTNDLTFNFL